VSTINASPPVATEGIPFATADLATCDRELIHIPGSIQSHGVLLVIDRRTRLIEQLAGDTHFLLGTDAGRVLGASVSTLMDEDSAAFVAARFDAPADCIAPIMRLGVVSSSGSLPLDVTISARGRTALMELEPARRTQSRSGDSISHLKTLLASLYEAGTVDQCLAAAAITLRATTGFDRAMVYEFQADGSGVVVAEDAAPGRERFLGLRYPASDIPPQARELYKRNWLRAIPTIHYEPSRLNPAVNPRTGGAIDMSDCSLRSVSPVHLEYLRNMGVTATLTLSVVCRGELWGMLVLHHYSPRHVPADLRVACETFAQVFSLQVEAKSHTERSLLQTDARRVREALVARLIDTPDPGASLATPDLLRYLRAEGAAVYMDRRLHRVGAAPSETQILELIAWIDPLLVAIHCSDSLAAEFPRAAEYAAIASGLMAMRLSSVSPGYVLWFRPEVKSTVRWAGDPQKAVSTGPLGSRLTPRGSFAEWLVLHSMYSTPWSEGDVEAVEGLRLGLLEAILRSFNAGRLEREKAFQRQKLLLAELDHRAKNTLFKIRALVRATEQLAPSTEVFSATLLDRLDNMARSDNLLAEGRWIGTSLGKIIADEIAPFVTALTPRVTAQGVDVLLTPIEALALNLVLQELVTNAFRHGALSTAAGAVAIEWHQTVGPQILEITWQEDHGPAVPQPLQSGIGMNLIRKTIAEELNGEVEFTASSPGLRCVIRLPTDALGTR
jgi:chemotaxis family two-component system sensor kinase Cph1